MIAAPKPPNEAKRLEALMQFRVLDTGPEECFDDFTRLASHLCDTPISLISLVDKDRQWFKSKVGLEAVETSRDLAFCAHAILEPSRLFIVPDAAEDERFADNPLVAGDPRIRFYAGAPLNARDGISLGTLCVIDRVPRELSPAQEEALAALGRRVTAQMELRRMSFALANALENISILEGLIPICCHCKSVRDDAGFWLKVEEYVGQNSDASFTHGVCPHCIREHYPEFAEEIESNQAV